MSARKSFPTHTPPGKDKPKASERVETSLLLFCLVFFFYMKTSAAPVVSPFIHKTALKRRSFVCLYENVVISLVGRQTSWQDIF